MIMAIYLNYKGVKLSMLRKKSETENLPVVKVKEQRQCHIHDKVGNVEAVRIREKVCVNENDDCLPNHTDGKYYCLFHLPTKEKDIPKFEEIYQTRLRTLWKQVDEIKKLPIQQQNQAKSKLAYDFPYVWFPSWVNLSELKFEVDANFYHATFSSQTDFWTATFERTANFNSATFYFEAKFNSNTTFKSKTDFGGASFKDKANFSTAIFENGVGFNTAIFSKDLDFTSIVSKEEVYFIKTTFEEGIYFTSATFEKEVFFREATFTETSNALFRNTNIKNGISFPHSNLNGHISFYGDGKNDIFVGNSAYVSLQSARIKDKDKISFNLVRLQPSWLINTDCRKFVFTACRWKKANQKNIDTKSELKNLPSSSFPHPHKLLTKTCWQLADNHEEMKSFPKASLFRQMANESKRREDYKGWKIWSLHWWYWLSSFYGERPLQALIILLGIIVAFAFYYYLAFFSICPKDIADSTKCVVRNMNWLESLHQSLMTAALQNVEYRKTLLPPQDLVMLFEKIVAPLQAALLALAIRRKFMR